MLLQNIMNSDDRRLCKRVILNQRESEDDNTFYATTKKILQKYDIDVDVENMTKSELKKKAKEKIRQKMAKIVREAAEKMTKLRFITEYEVGRKEYITKMDGTECLHTMKTRLNMLPIYANFKGDVTMDSACAHCKTGEDKTEHLVECEAIGETILTKEDLKNSDNVELWRLINERTRFNLNHRPNKKPKE